MKIKKIRSLLSETFTSTDFILLLTTAVIIYDSILGLYVFRHDLGNLHFKILSTNKGLILFVIPVVLLMFRLGFFSYIFYNFKNYKPIQSVSDNLLPTCTVIVPAYNEGKLVYETLLSIANSNYPKDKMQLISIDDGSKDDTWDWIKKAHEELGDFVTIYKQPENKGKRAALYKGFNLATGEVLITIDSDSIVTEDTIRNLVSPFVADENCGAVAGNVAVLNNEEEIIPKMLNVSFAFSFEFIRSAQSNLGSVLCTPGALAAYRKTAVMNCLEEWINQSFLGVKSDIGEDRAMTNMILKQGYKVFFQKNAKVYTNVPESYNSLRKMFTRWERSNVRENIMLSKFAFRKYETRERKGTIILLANQWLNMLTAFPAIISMVMFLVLHPGLFFSTTIFSVFIFSSIPAFFYATKYSLKDCFWAYTYGIFYAFGLFWIAPYAIATVKQKGWLTR